MEYLFIGGSRDGQRMSVLRDRVVLPVINGCAVYGDVKDHAVIECEEYRSFRIRGETKVFTVYALADSHPDAVIDGLIQGYRGSD